MTFFNGFVKIDLLKKTNTFLLVLKHNKKYTYPDIQRYSEDLSVFEVRSSVASRRGHIVRLLQQEILQKYGGTIKCPSVTKQQETLLSYHGGNEGRKHESNS